MNRITDAPFDARFLRRRRCALSRVSATLLTGELRTAISDKLQHAGSLDSG